MSDYATSLRRSHNCVSLSAWLSAANVAVGSAPNKGAGRTGRGDSMTAHTLRFFRYALQYVLHVR